MSPGHPENKDVMLRLMSLEDKKITVLAKLFGGQGTINVPSWSPDSKSVAFVSYQMVAAEKTEQKWRSALDASRRVRAPVAPQSLFSNILVEEPRHDLQRLFGFRQLEVIPEGMRQRLENHQLCVDAGAK